MAELLQQGQLDAEPKLEKLPVTCAEVMSFSSHRLEA